MLANLTALIWGSEPTPTTAAATSTTTATKISSSTAGQEVTETQSAYNIRASTPADEEESDWVLVDRASESHLRWSLSLVVLCLIIPFYLILIN